jgi:hypothetical protein
LRMRDDAPEWIEPCSESLGRSSLRKPPIERSSHDGLRAAVQPGIGDESGGETFVAVMQAVDLVAGESFPDLRSCKSPASAGPRGRTGGVGRNYMIS